MKELSLTGNYYEMGKQYGQGCRKEIKLFVKTVYFMVSISKKPGSTAFSPNMRYMLQTLVNLSNDKKSFRNSLGVFEAKINQYFPESLEMIRGIAEGSKCEYEDILFLNIAVDVMLNCSCWGASGTATTSGHTLIGMNADEEKMTQKYEVMLHLNPDSGYAVKGTAMMGSVCLNHGMNETGLALASHLYFLKSTDPSTKNIPLFVMYKALFHCRSVAEVSALYDTLPNIDIGAVFYIADSERFLKIECSSTDRISETIKDGVRGTTNIPEEECIKVKDLFGEYSDKKNMNARHRQKRMKNLLDQWDGRIDVNAMISIASDHGGEDETQGKSICQHGAIKTVVSFIADPEEKKIYVFEGNPCENKMFCYGF